MVQPVFLVVVLLVVACVLLWRGRQLRVGRWLATIGTLLLLFISLQVVPFVVGRVLESQYPTYTPAPNAPEPVYVVVLGGGVRENEALPLSARLSPPALARLVEGIRIVQMHPSAYLVVTGGKVFSRVSEAEVAADVAMMLGVDSTRIVREDESLDTHDQAQRIAAIAGDRPVVLVTSAVHMPRSVALFRRQGLDPRPAPTAHLFDGDFIAGPRSLLPTAEHLRATEIVMHEVYGLLWSKLVGII